jgi:hypothetical protein
MAGLHRDRAAITARLMPAQRSAAAEVSGGFF